MAKVGRNENCSCGSGKKYKKCCLTEMVTLNEKNKINESFMNKVKKQYPGQTVITPNDPDILNMSEVLLEFADELLQEAETIEAEKRVIMLAIVAWNVGLLEEHEQDEKIELFMLESKIKRNSKSWQDMFNLIKTLVCKKQIKYPEMDRAILSFEFDSKSGEPRFSVVSTMTEA